MPLEPYFQRDGITLYHGDCRDILPSLPKVDLVLTSPPYGDQREYEDGIEEWDDVVPPALSSIAKDDETQILVNLGLIHRDGEVVEYWEPLKRAMRREGWRLFGWYIWDQGSGLPGDWQGRFAPSHEFIFHFNRQSCQLEKPVPCVSFGRRITGTGLRSRDGSTAGQMSQQGAAVQRTKIPDSVIRVTREMRRTIDHPAVFPKRFAMELMRGFPRGTVLDPFAGSGTTLRAAMDLGRKAIGIEISEKYCEIAARRLEQRSLRFSEVL